ncbi:hypothetical protein N2K95_05825 [Arthrobacter zhaoxinii]|uniref:DUF2157 domain-containing protein n=1 Tax=Arthrobacter zhaoxinii TaxID=2964616 RepID=A0ABY5YVC1_9MICC|nr:hypothetical protein [Arthrobacter zhaoxinii]UWX98176.1 hypothetical protein N2K95_05825 [Arthrobacter zhaoxinii]
MSSDSVIMPSSGEPLPDSGGNTDPLALDAVDTFDITARLEASGLSDRTVAKRHGAPDVFAYAQSLVQVRNSVHLPLEPERWLSRDALLEAVRRAVVLIMGAVLGGMTATVMTGSTTEVLTAGISAWVVGQSVSGIVWAHANSGQLKRGIAHGSGATILVTAALACFMVVLLLLPAHDASLAFLIMAWCWYSCIVSMLVILGRSWYLMTVLAFACAAVTLTLVLGHGSAKAIVLTIAALVLAAVTLALAIQLRKLSEPVILGSADWRSAAAPAFQAACLAAALSVALTRLPAWEGTALIVATVVAAAATDPALVLMRQRLMWSSRRTPLLRHAARNAWIVTMGMSAAIVLISASVSTLVVLFLVGYTQVATTVIAAAVFSSLATTSTTLNAFGLPTAGVVFAGAAPLSAMVWILVGNLAGVLVAVAFLVAGIAVLLARVSDPRAYA